MAGPLDIEIVAEIEWEIDAPALEFIHDGAVVDALDRDLLAGFLIKKAAALFANPGDADGANSEELFRHQKIRTRLLFFGVNFHRDNSEAWGRGRTHRYRLAPEPVDRRKGKGRPVAQPVLVVTRRRCHAPG